MSALESVAKRNLDTLFPDRATLIVNPPSASMRSLLADVGCTEIETFSHYAKRDLTPCSSGLTPAANNAQQIVWFLQRERQLRQWMAAVLAASCDATARVLAIGENQAGAKSAARQLASAFGSVVKADSARHCTVYLCEKPIPDPDVSLPETVFGVEYQNSTLEAVTVPGVFSHGHLDHGTELLLAHLPQIEGSILDFGCGCGVIAAALASNPENRVTASDVSALALEATRRTFRRNGFAAPELLQSDGLPAGRWDAIVTNPPFHDGIHTHYDTTRDMIKAAPDHLNPRGRLIVVANTHLGYAALMKSVFRSVEILAQTRRFVVISARL